MNTEFIEFRDELATLAELDSDLDYTPVNVDEGFVSLDVYACHYIHHQNDDHATIRFYMLEGEDTISSKCDEPSFVYHSSGAQWSCPNFLGHPTVSSVKLAQMCLQYLRKLAERPA